MSEQDAQPAKQRRRRTRQQREADQAIVAKLWCQGKSIREIAEITGVSRSVTHDNLRAIRQRWAQDAQRSIGERTADELGKIDHLEQTYWKAYEEEGDLRCLQGAERTIDRRCRLLGLDAPQKIAPTDPSGQLEYGSVPLDQQRLILLAVAQRLGLPQLQPAIELQAEQASAEQAQAEQE